MPSIPLPIRLVPFSTLYKVSLGAVAGRVGRFHSPFPALPIAQPLPLWDTFFALAHETQHAHVLARWRSRSCFSGCPRFWRSVKQSRSLRAGMWTENSSPGSRFLTSQRGAPTQPSRYLCRPTLRWRPWTGRRSSASASRRKG